MERGFTSYLPLQLRDLGLIIKIAAYERNSGANPLAEQTTEYSPAAGAALRPFFRDG